MELLGGSKNDFKHNGENGRPLSKKQIFIRILNNLNKELSLEFIVKTNRIDADHRIT